MKKLIFLSALFILGCEQPPVAVEPEPEETAQLDPQRCLEIDPMLVVDNEIFRITDEGGVGAFSMAGIVQSMEGEVPFSGERVEFVYLVLSDDGSEVFDYFVDLAGKQDIDKLESGQLYLKLGILENGELRTSASLSREAEGKIVSALSSGETITLNMLMGSSLGQGASTESVHPCLIEG